MSNVINIDRGSEIRLQKLQADSDSKGYANPFRNKEVDYDTIYIMYVPNSIIANEVIESVEFGDGDSYDFTDNPVTVQSVYIYDLPTHTNLLVDTNDNHKGRS